MPMPEIAPARPNDVAFGGSSHLGARPRVQSRRSRQNINNTPSKVTPNPFGINRRKTRLSSPSVGRRPMGTQKAVARIVIVMARQQQPSAAVDEQPSITVQLLGLCWPCAIANYFRSFESVWSLVRWLFRLEPD